MTKSSTPFARVLLTSGAALSFTSADHGIGVERAALRWTHKWQIPDERHTGLQSKSDSNPRSPASIVFRDVLAQMPPPCWPARKPRSALASAAVGVEIGARAVGVTG